MNLSLAKNAMKPGWQLALSQICDALEYDIFDLKVNGTAKGTVKT